MRDPYIILGAFYAIVGFLVGVETGVRRSRRRRR